MNRRHFIKVLAGSSVLAVFPIAAFTFREYSDDYYRLINSLKDYGYVRDESFYLYAVDPTIVIEDGWSITCCAFQKNVNGNALVYGAKGDSDPVFHIPAPLENKVFNYNSVSFVYR